ncbi:DNA methylase [Pseudomonas sp. Y24-6]|uniref:DNA methylase n=1 Tax=Pseudomonas sp. Y24-6 TaxID=2750013 RepID=UPI001CE18CE4|nr:DNA methylase [Pseudomonas sp. Y24-6]MCA4964297.1 DNA methylase [Pseudomonas sp. Y24-6]
MSKNISAHDLRIELQGGNEAGLFKWLLASFLMGKRIQGAIAAKAYQVIIEQHQLDTPQKLAHCTHRQLVVMLGQAHYVRYDETTASRLLALASKLNVEYEGKVSNIAKASADLQAFEKRLSEFEGIGPKTIEIFMREASAVLFRSPS